METLITAYLHWCDLLDIRVTKALVWSSTGPGHPIHAAGRSWTTSPFFRIVGTVLGTSEQSATTLHFAPRLEKALTTSQRLQTLALPASIRSLLWRSTVLSQALYGTEVRNITPSQLRPLALAGQSILSSSPPIALNIWAAAEVLSGPPLGDTAFRHPMCDARLRQLRWLQLLVNLPSIVGVLHRELASSSPTWSEPTPSLLSALTSLGWSLRPNPQSLQAAHWPLLSPEAAYPGPVLLQPVDSFPEANAVFTDGSVALHGGAAAVCPDTDSQLSLTISTPRSSTHCELVALCLALQLSPPQILTDSLTALQLITRWATLPPSRILRCPDRIDIRRFLHLASQQPSPPLLEKVKAHDTAAIALGHPKSLGNDAADQHARQAATSSSSPPWAPNDQPFHDAVQLFDSSHNPILSVDDAFLHDWWARSSSACTSRRPRMLSLYPTTTPIDWPASCYIFRRPVVSGSSFHHFARPAVIKWVARLRAGSLPTRERLHRHHLVASPACPCCSAPVEDEDHMLFDCPATGSANWLPSLQAAWATAASSLPMPLPPPPDPWLAAHRTLLVSALLPSSITSHLSLSPADTRQFLLRLHQALASHSAELLRRREDLISSAASSSGASPPRPNPCPLPPERQLPISTLRHLEVASRAPTTSPIPSPAVPSGGDARRLWLRARLHTLLTEDTDPCPTPPGTSALIFLEWFEHHTGEPFSECRDAPLTSRLRALSRVLGNLSREEPFNPPLRSVTHRSFLCWNRCPRRHVDVEAWRTRVEAAEAAVSRPSLAATLNSVDAGLADWIRHHPHLSPTEVDRGESGMALLILWEVDHQRPFPSRSASDPKALLASFNKRLLHRVAQHPELSQWLTTKVLQLPLAPGIPPSHHLRWSLRICPPADPTTPGWYAEFTTRWRSYLEQLVAPTPPTPAAPSSALASSSSSAAAAPARLLSPSHEALPGSSAAPASARRPRPPGPTRPAKQPRLSAPSRPAPRPPPPPTFERQPPRPLPSPDTTAPPPKRQRTLDLWMQAGNPSSSTTTPEDPTMCRHGRAAAGPPT